MPSVSDRITQGSHLVCWPSQENNASRVVGPTSFAGGIRQIAAASKRAAVAGRAPALMTMLAGSGGARDHDAGGNDMNALKMASFKSKR